MKLQVLDDTELQQLWYPHHDVSPYSRNFHLDELEGSEFMGSTLRYCRQKPYFIHESDAVLIYNTLLTIQAPISKYSVLKSAIC